MRIEQGSRPIYHADASKILHSGIGGVEVWHDAVFPHLFVKVGPVDPELSGEAAQMKIKEIQGAGADMVVSSCQQCLRTIATRAPRRNIDLVVKNLADLVTEALR